MNICHAIYDISANRIATFSKKVFKKIADRTRKKLNLGRL